MNTIEQRYIVTVEQRYICVNDCAIDGLEVAVTRYRNGQKICHVYYPEGPSQSRINRILDRAVVSVNLEGGEVSIVAGVDKETYHAA